MTLRKYLRREASVPAAGKETERKYGTDQTTEQLVKRHLSEGETKLMHLHAKCLVEGSVTEFVGKVMLRTV